jgi:hypothetical protein
VLWTPDGPVLGRDGDTSWMTSTPPWWYRIPPIATTLITYAVTASALYAAGAGASAALIAGLVVGLVASVVQGAAQRAHDERQQQ